MLDVLKKLFGSKHEKDVKALRPLVDVINGYCEQYKGLTDEELRAKTTEFRGRIQEALKDVEEKLAGLRSELEKDIDPAARERLLDDVADAVKERDELTAETLEELLPEAFAVVKDACRRLVGTTFDLMGHPVVWDMIPFDVQIIGGVVLHQGKIAEMATGEGKTLVATMPIYLNALPARGVHLVTVNDYLAKRDSLWMGMVFEFLGLTVGCIQNTMDSIQRRKEYACDITYGTNNEFGFDYLRDNMVVDKVDLVQREYFYAIVDEVDSVLIDEARTPLIISGPVKSEDHKFDEMKPAVDRLVSAQRNFVSKIVGEAEKFLEEKKEKDAGVLLLRASRGLPKHPRLLKLVTEPSNKKLILETENEYLRDQSRRMHEIDDELYYAIDEKDHQISLTEKGRDFLMPITGDRDFFVLPDLGTETIIPLQRNRCRQRRTRSISSTPRGATGSTPCRSFCGPTRSIRRTTSTSSPTTERSRSSMSSPDASFPDGGIPKGCTRRLRRRKVSRSNGICRPLPPSRCRITSGSMGSWRG
jgi:preprotein translocase subunit SecA